MVCARSHSIKLFYLEFTLKWLVFSFYARHSARPNLLNLLTKEMISIQITNIEIIRFYVNILSFGFGSVLLISSLPQFISKQARTMPAWIHDGKRCVCQLCTAQVYTIAFNMHGNI